MRYLPPITKNQEAVLDALQQNPQEYRRPSLSRLSELSGVKKSSVAESLKSLKKRTYITDHDRVNEELYQELKTEGQE